MMLPPELRRPAPRGDNQSGAAPAGDQGDAHKRRLAAIRQARRRKRARLGKPAPARASKHEAADKPDQPHRKPRKLGKACGHAVMLLNGRNGAYVQLMKASPKLTATAEGHDHDYDTFTLADALELLVPIHEEHAPPGGGYRVPTLAALETAAKQERERQTVADIATARREEANAAFLEAATYDADSDEDQAVERDRHAPVTHVTRDGVTRNAPRHATEQTDASATGSNSNGLDAAGRHAPRHANRHDPALSSSSSSLSSSSPVDAQRETTTTKGMERDGQRDADNADEPQQASEGAGRANGPTASVKPVDRTPEARGGPARESLRSLEEINRLDRRTIIADKYASTLGMAAGDVLRLWYGSEAERRELFEMLKAAGVDLATGLLRGGSAAQAAGIPIPRIGMDAPRVAHAADQGNKGDDYAGQVDGQGNDTADQDQDQDQDDADQLVDLKAG